MPKTISFQELQRTIQTRVEEGDTWTKIGREYGLYPSILWRIVNEDYEPKREDIRQKLNLHQTIIKKLPRDEKGRFTSNGGSKDAHHD
jgi:hypothetical protein